MKTKIKLLALVTACVLTSIVNDAFSALEEPSVKRYTTVVCTTTHPDGHETFHSACNEPAAKGPCDIRKDCW